MAGIQKLGKYLIRRELGKGAMGVVYEAFDPAIERIVAIKTILPKRLVSAEGAEMLARFKREAQAAGRLNHPGIVAVYDYGETMAEDDDATFVASDTAINAAGAEPVAYIAMEFVKGRELREFFEANERFALPDVARLMGEILSALGHAHAHGVVHRDIKPANLIVLDDGRVKIADFGIARVEKSELTQAGAAIGTPAYMSPEQFLGQTVDGRSDLFSCAVILYQFLTGEKPFTGNSTTIMYKVLQEEPLAPSILNVAIPGGFDAVMQKAIAKKPDERFQTAADFAAAITEAVANPAAAARAAGADATVINQSTVQVASPPLAAAAPPAAAPAIPVNPHKPAARAANAGTATGNAAANDSGNAPSRNVLYGAVAVGVLAVAGAGFMFLGRDRAPTAPVSAAAPAPATAAASAPTAPSSQSSAPGAPAASPASAASTDAPAEPGTVIISALGLVNPGDARFNGDAAAAQTEARADAKRQLVEKAVALYVDSNSLNKNYAVIEQKMLAQPGVFIKTVLQDGAPVAGKDGLIESEARAVLKLREVQKSLNQLSRDERIDFIRNHGDPKVSILMSIANADTAQALPPARSQLAENIVKERIKSFGFRVWANDGEAKTGPDAKGADFLISGEVKVKLLSAKLAASGLTVTKTVLTSWTVKAIDKASGEEIYLNTVMPKGKSWATEDQAMAEIGKLMGDEFSKNFFLQHFNFGVRPVSLDVTGLPDAASARLLLRELRAMRQVLDARLTAESGKYQLQLPEGRVTELVQEAIIKPLNAKLGQACFTLAGSSDAQVSLSFATACSDAAVRGKMETLPPAGLAGGSTVRGAPLLKSGAAKAAT